MKRPSSRCDNPAFGMIDRAASPGRRRAHRLERIDAGRRAGPAVHPDRVRARRRQRVRGRPRTAPVDEHELLAEGQRGDDRKVGGEPGLVHRQHELVEVGERLEHDQVGPTLEQALDLLAERGPGGRLRDDRHAPRRRTERADRTADQGIASRDLAGLARELRRAPVQPADLSLEAPGRESPAVGPERQRLDQVRARLEILPMGGADHLRMSDDELLETGPLGHAATEQERAQPTVDEKRACVETTQETLPRRAADRWFAHQSPVEARRSGTGTGGGKTLPARKGLAGSSLIVQEDLPGLGTLPARRR